MKKKFVCVDVCVWDRDSDKTLRWISTKYFTPNFKVKISVEFGSAHNCSKSFKMFIFQIFKELYDGLFLMKSNDTKRKLVKTDIFYTDVFIHLL